MIAFEILTRGLFRRDQVSVDYDPTRQLQVTTEERAWMDALWQEKLAQARRQHTLLFDAPTYRFIESRISSDGTQLLLTVGPTSYKEYVTTRVPEFTQQHTRAELGNTLAVCSVVETSDDMILLDKRQGVDVSNGRYHVIGGIIERGRDELTAQMTEHEQVDPFGAMCREIREETGVLESDIAEQYCLGTVYDLETPHGELIFLTRLHISLAEVKQRTPEDREIQQLHELQVTPESLRDFILTNHGANLSTTGEPNLLLYGQWKFGESWLVKIMDQLT